MPKNILPRRPSVIIILSILLLIPLGVSGAPIAPTALADQPCQALDNGSGTVDLPPNACDFKTPENVFGINEGLPPGTTIEIVPIMTDFVCSASGCSEPGGNLGGERETFAATLILQLSGTGELDGFRRAIRMPIQVITDSGPRTPGDPIQIFPVSIYQFQGLVIGDPDFELLQITGGENFGLPSPGSATLTDLSNGYFNVDIFYDFNYQIQYVGAPGGELDGYSGTTTAATQIDVFNRPAKSIENDQGDGTVILPPILSQYQALLEDMQIIDGLPPGTTISVEPSLHTFVCDPYLNCEQPGGDLGGAIQSYQATLTLKLTGSGDLDGFNRILTLPAEVVTQSGERIPGNPIQIFATDLSSLTANLPLGDPDFTVLHIESGTNHGLASPGTTTLISLGDGNYFVDSFFDIWYRIDFSGEPGSALEGLAGSTTGITRLTAFHDPYARPYKTWMPLILK